MGHTASELVLYLVVRQETKGKVWGCILQVLGCFLGGWSYLLLEHDTWTRKHARKTSVPMTAAENLLVSMGKQGRLWKEIPLREEIKPGALFCH